MSDERPSPGPGKCAHCDRPAVCFGVYEDPEGEIERACGTCCAHGNEDGWCKPIVSSEDRHIAGHVFNAKDLDEAIAYVTQYRHDVESEEHVPEICICAAHRLPDGRVFRGHRHGDAMRTAREYIDYRYSIGLEPADYEGMRADMDPESQGFVTSRNRYVGREEGLALQHAAGIESACPSGYRARFLFSEDLY